MFSIRRLPDEQPCPPFRIMTHKDYEGSKLGMWLFLFTEILLFGGLFILYSAYRARYPLEFHDGGQHLNVVIGVANTIILLTSSLTVALSITRHPKGRSQDFHSLPGGDDCSRSRISGEQIHRMERGDSPWSLPELPCIAAAPAWRPDILWSLLQHDRIARPACSGRNCASVRDACTGDQGKNHEHGF